MLVDSAWLHAFGNNWDYLQSPLIQRTGSSATMLVAKAKIPTRVQDILWTFAINNWQSEPGLERESKPCGWKDTKQGKGKQNPELLCGTVAYMVIVDVIIRALSITTLQ